MKANVKININLDGLAKIKKELSKGYYAKVGILGDDAVRTDESGISNPELGMIQEFGSLTNNIPPRSFLRMPIELKRREIAKFLTSKSSRKLIETMQIEKLFARLGVFAEGIVQGAFATGGYGQWPSLKPATVKRKGSAAPLIDTGQLRQSISSEVGKDG